MPYKDKKKQYAAVERWRRRNVEKVRAYGRNQYWKWKDIRPRPDNKYKRYGITKEQYDAIFAAQNFSCAICGTTNPRGHGWVMDHDHTCCNNRESGKYNCGRCNRGILCTNCNTALGLIKENIATLEQMKGYLQKYEHEADCRAS